MSYITGSTFSGANISTALLLTSYTIVTPGKYTFQIYLDGVAGGGDYTVNARRKRLGVGTDYPLVPKTTYTAAAGAQGFGFLSIDVECLANDLISFYGLGLAGDTAITGTVDIFMNDWVRSTTPANTFNVSATGEGELNFDEVIEGTTTFRQLLKLMSSVLFGKSSGGGTGNVIFRDIGDTKPRITATVDANGNRTSVTKDGT